MCRISCIPTESLIFTGSKLRRPRLPLCSVPFQKKINIKHFSNSCFNSNLKHSFISLYNFSLLVSLFHGLGQWGRSKKRAGEESGLVEPCCLWSRQSSLRPTAFSTVPTDREPGTVTSRDIFLSFSDHWCPRDYCLTYNSRNKIRGEWFLICLNLSRELRSRTRVQKAAQVARRMGRIPSRARLAASPQKKFRARTHSRQLRRLSQQMKTSACLSS